MKEHAMIIVINKYASQALKAAWIATPQGRKQWLLNHEKQGKESA